MPFIELTTEEGAAMLFNIDRIICIAPIYKNSTKDGSWIQVNDLENSIQVKESLTTIHTQIKIIEQHGRIEREKIIKTIEKNSKLLLDFLEKYL